jgi:hypothetical protein
MVATPPTARRTAGLLALLAALLFAQPALAQTAAPDRNATARTTIVRPTQVRKMRELDFAFLNVPLTAGTAIIDPNTDAMTTTGGVLHLGGTPYAAQFEAVSPSKAVVIIRAPRNPITLTRVGGTETMTVSNWTVSGQARRTVAAQEPFSFKVGGTLNVNANQVEGTYIGTFQVDIQYP